MHRTFLLELLQALSAEDRREFELFLKSPYHNRGKSAAEVCLLYERLNAVLVDTSVKTPAKEEVFQQIAPELPWDNWKTDKLIAALGKLLRAFLLTRFNLQDDQEFRQQLDFANILHTFGLNERNQQILTRLQTFQEQFSWRNSDFYFRQYQLESAKFEMETFYNRKKGDLNVPQVLYNLDLF
ncbi:MAG: hypothetical protein IT260_13235 [Saprospiraceae bacterium]|nr:hypothetical protein [Saprospiraceae bacterium]